MNTTIIERLQMAIFEAIAGQPSAIITGAAARRAAVAALEAILPPSDDMMEAALSVCGVAPQYDPAEAVRDTFTAMIRTALNEENSVRKGTVQREDGISGSQAVQDSANALHGLPGALNDRNASGEG